MNCESVKPPFFWITKSPKFYFILISVFSFIFPDQIFTMWQENEVSDTSFVLAGCELLVSTIRSAIHQRGQAVVGLSGGSTPKDIFTMLGSRQDVEWQKVVSVAGLDQNVLPLMRSRLLGQILPCRRAVY
jgi:hypothetical protein